MSERASKVSLRPATPDDAIILRQWDRRPHIMAAKGTEDWGWERELARSLTWREQLIAEVDGRPIGYLEIINPAREESHYWGVLPEGFRAIDIWIGEESELGKGYGTQMMRLALSRCFADQTVSIVLVDPLANNIRAHRFYERVGFRFLEHRRFGGDECCVYRLDRQGVS